MRSTNIPEDSVDVAVVGGGPAGMMAAVAAAPGRNVLLLDRNARLGVKLLLTGHGRCNLTNLSDLDTTLSRYHNSDFLRNGFARFCSGELVEFFENAGLKLKVERGQRVYPESDRAEDVVRVLAGLLEKNRVRVLLGTLVKEIERREASFRIRTARRDFVCERLVLACGGKSYPSTGSTGDGYRFARAFGHTIVPLSPALCGLELEENWVRQWNNFTLRNAGVRVLQAGRVIEEDFGDVEFTDYGVSGPVIMNLSGTVGSRRAEGKMHLSINFKPALNMEKLRLRIERELERGSRRKLANIFPDILPNVLIKAFLWYSRLDGEKPANQVTREERERIVRNLHDFRLTIHRTRDFRESMVTRGGVSVKEINPQTMESKLVPGLYFAGEMIDMDGRTGGYNLQAAFTTGYLAGSACNH